jgi:hypothetical protein
MAGVVMYTTVLSVHHSSFIISGYGLLLFQFAFAM